jgi:hypothetical protein
MRAVKGSLGHSPWGQSGGNVYARVRQYFNEQELVNLTMVVVTINGWNRLAIGFRWPVGGYQPKRSSVT